jgi:hypothetical protein
LVNTPSDLQPVKNGMKMQPQWELKNIEGGIFIWNHNHNRFDCIQNDHIMDKALYKLMVEITTRLGTELVKRHIKSFEVQPVFAVRT